MARLLSTDGIHIVVSRIQYIKPFQSRYGDKKTRIYFDKDDYVDVARPIDEIVDALTEKE